MNVVFAIRIAVTVRCFLVAYSGGRSLLHIKKDECCVEWHILLCRVSATRYGTLFDPLYVMDFVTCGSWHFCYRRILLIALTELSFPSLLPFSARLFRAAFGHLSFFLYPAFPLTPLDDVHSEEFPSLRRFLEGIGFQMLQNMVALPKFDVMSDIIIVSYTESVLQWWTERSVDQSIDVSSVEIHAVEKWIFSVDLSFLL
jgi:hypothetical protein